MRGSGDGSLIRLPPTIRSGAPTIREASFATIRDLGHYATEQAPTITILVYSLQDSGAVRYATKLLRYVACGYYDTQRSCYDT